MLHQWQLVIRLSAWTNTWSREISFFAQTFLSSYHAYKDRSHVENVVLIVIILHILNDTLNALKQPSVEHDSYIISQKGSLDSEPSVHHFKSG